MNDPRKQNPNIVFILSDDQGAWALGCAGNKEIRTPHLDGLAGSGIRFANFFCVSPVCSPARASILTGRIPSAHGVHDWIRSGNVDYESLPTSLKQSNVLSSEKKPIEYLQGQLAYTELLADHGYVCGLSGKWHLGDSIRPQKGFSHWFTLARGGCDYYKPDTVRNGRVAFEDHYITNLISDDALVFLEEQRSTDAPFYLGVHYTAPHSPWEREQHPSEIYDSYEACAFESVPDMPAHPWLAATAPRGEGKLRKELLQGYYAAVTAMDQGIGRILDKLKAMGVRDNTLVIFSSDNGMNMGHHGIWGKGNGTFPQNMFDTSVKVPMIISHPAAIPGGRVCEELLSHYDVFPTLLDYLDIPCPAVDSLPGRSFASVLQGLPDPQRESNHRPVVVFDEYGPVRMIRTTEWKYVHRYPYGPHELYHLADDPDEERNLVEEPLYADTCRRLKAQLTDWFVQYTDPTLDGTHEAVSGFGQLNLAGPGGRGNEAFVQTELSKRRR